MIRHLRRIGSAILIVRLPGGLQVAVPEWMLNPQACQHLTDQAEPRIAIEALEELRRLIEAQTLVSAETLVVVQNPQQEEIMHNNEGRGSRQPALSFEDEELWSALPVQVRESCRSLWRQLLASVLAPRERRQNERED